MPADGCLSCVFWRRDQRPARTESPEHADWRPCGNVAPRLKRVGGQEARRGSARLWTAPDARRDGYAPVQAVTA